MTLLRAVAALIGTLAACVVVAGPAHADRLSIPSIGVSAPIQEVGVRDGAQESPANLWRVYHWRLGVKPCAPGSTVLAGHNYEVPGGRAVFRHLDRLRVGAKVRIVRPGKDCTYRVTSNRRVPMRRSIERLYDFDGPARGYLITCTGRTGPGQYTHRRIVAMTMIGARR